MVTRKIGWLGVMSGLGGDEEGRRAEIVRGHAPDWVQIESVALVNGPRFLGKESDFQAAMAAAGDAVTRIDPAEYPVIVLAGAIDPGLDQLRDATDATVIGALETCMFLTSAMRRRVSIIATDDIVRKQAEATVMENGTFGTQVVSVRAIGHSVATIVGSLTDMTAMKKVKQDLRRAARSAVDDDGAEAIFLGSMTLGTLEMSEILLKELRVPILDPIRVSIGAAVECLAAIPAAEAGMTR